MSLVFVALGVGVCVLGAAARRGRLELTWGSHTRETTDPASWRQAHRVAGSWLIAVGVIYLAVAIAVLAAGGRERVDGWVVGVSCAVSVVMLYLMMAAGLRALREAAPEVDTSPG